MGCQIPSSRVGNANRSRLTKRMHFDLFLTIVVLWSAWIASLLNDFPDRSRSERQQWSGRPDQEQRSGSRPAKTRHKPKTQKQRKHTTKHQPNRNGPIRHWAFNSPFCVSDRHRSAYLLSLVLVLFVFFFCVVFWLVVVFCVSDRHRSAYLQSMDHEMNDLFFSAVFWMGVVFCVLGLAVGVFWAIFPD